MCHSKAKNNNNMNTAQSIAAKYNNNMSIAQSIAVYLPEIHN